MAQLQSSAKILSGALTVFGLGLVWIAVAANWPSQEELTAVDAPLATAGTTARSVAAPEPPPPLDMTIPTSSPLPADAPPSMAPMEPNRSPTLPLVGQGHPQEVVPTPDVPDTMPLSGAAQQVATLKCEAEIERLCPDSTDRKCLHQQVKQLPPMCRQQVRERFVKWKEDRSRFAVACEADVKRFCSAVKPGEGRVLQCLHAHAQDVSDQCYQTLPKGKLLFR